MEAVERAARIWAMRGRTEHEAASRFARLATRLATVEALPIVVDMTRESAADELVHARRCAELAARFGHPSHPEAGPMPHEIAPTDLPLSRRVLHEVVALSCITETLSAALLGEIRERATDAAVRDTAHVILTDEIRHARLGWAHLASTHGRADDGRRAREELAPYLPRMLAATIGEELAAPGADGADAEELAGLGSLPRSVRARVFVETMREVVFPGFERLDVDATAARRWLADTFTSDAPRRVAAAPTRTAPSRRRPQAGTSG